MHTSPNLYDILEALEKRPPLFLGNGYTFHSLDNFITGFTIAAQSTQLEKPTYPNFAYFNTWILGHLNEHFGLAGGWHCQIHNRNLHNDKKAFEEFFYFLEIFKRSPITSKSIVITDADRQRSKNGLVKRYITPEMKEETNDDLFKIRWLQIANSTTTWIEFLDESNTIIHDSWYLNASEANEALEKEFTKFDNEWQ